jgi:hypothetical protein
MEPIIGIFLAQFPYENLSKVEDLMYYDGPILSHYKNYSNNKNYLFYWVDYDSDFNRWLVWELTELDLYDYLYKNYTLLDLIKDASLHLLLDVDDESEYKNIHLLTNFYQIPEKYVKGADVYYSFSMPEIYKKASVYKKPTQILTRLREDGYIFRMKTDALDYGRAIKLHDAGDFLVNLGKSASEFIQNDFFHNFKDKYNSKESLDRGILNIKKTTEPLMVNTAFNSFEIMLSIPHIVGYYGEDNIQRDWRKNILNKYSKEVIEVDYESVGAYEGFLEKFPNKEVREKIVYPIVKILSKNEYTLEVKDSKGKVIKEHISMSKEARKRYNKDFNLVDDTKSKKKLMNIVVEVNEKEGQITYNSKSIKDGLFSETELKSINISYDIVSYQGIEIIFKKSVVFEYFIEDDNRSTIINKDFDININGETKAFVLREAQKELINKIILLRDNNEKRDLILNFVEEISEI